MIIIAHNEEDLVQAHPVNPDTEPPFIERKLRVRFVQTGKVYEAFPINIPPGITTAWTDDDWEVYLRSQLNVDNEIYLEDLREPSLDKNDVITAVMKVMMDEINILRDKARLPPRAWGQVRDAIKANL